MIKQNSYELSLFEKFKNNIDVVVDIGCRDNLDYYFIKPNANFHLFDINQKHVDKLINTISSLKHKINLYNIGLSNKNAKVKYGEASESIYRPWGNIIECDIRKFDEILIEKNIQNIDFLKMDIEGCEPEILCYTEIINNIKYIQFEYGQVWDRSKTNIKNICDTYATSHEFYFVKDINHPLTNTESAPLLTTINDSFIEKIESYTNVGCGCNILMFNKKCK
jgi:FkbM family methyltransferase